MSAARALAASLAREHPGDAARVCEAAAAAEVAAFLAELPAEHAAMVIERAAPVAAADVLARMEPEGAAAIAGRLEPHAGAALLRRLPEAASRALLARLPQDAATRLETLSRYRPDQAASRLDPRAPAVTPETRAASALDVVRRAAEGALDYVYVVTDDQRLCGVVSMRELMLAAPGAPVRSVMTQNPHRLLAEEPLEVAVRHPGWRKVHAMPVVDGAGTFLGVIRYSQMRAIEAELGAIEGTADSRTASALAELFWIGGAAIARLGEAAMFGRRPPEPEGDPR